MGILSGSGISKYGNFNLLILKTLRAWGAGQRAKGKRKMALCSEPCAFLWVVMISDVSEMNKWIALIIKIARSLILINQHLVKIS